MTLLHRYCTDDYDDDDDNVEYIHSSMGYTPFRLHKLYYIYSNMKDGEMDNWI